jgi:phosphoribosyl 1,2-cyclic phosphodiesterase
MPIPPVANLRVHFYGVQGSGSLFPGRKERMAYQQSYACDLLQHIYERMRSFERRPGEIDCSPETFFGGPPGPKTFASFLERAAIPEPRVYGGWTTCVRIETADGYDVVLDCGSGFRNCAADLQEKWGDRNARDLYLFGSHSHVDHTEGFDQAAVCFDPRNHVHVYGNRQFLQALDQNLGIFSRHVDASVLGLHTPITYRIMPSHFSACQLHNWEEDLNESQLADEYHDLRQPIVLGTTTIQPFSVHHPAPCLAYRVERNQRVFVFCTDHELRYEEEDSPAVRESREAESRLRQLAQGADLMYRDGQYLRAEYEGQCGIGDTGAIPRVGWGHSCMEDVTTMAEECGIRRTLIGHHDPNRSWQERNAIDEQLAQLGKSKHCQFELAKADTWIDLP